MDYIKLAKALGFSDAKIMKTSEICIDAQKMAEAVGMICWAEDGFVRYFTLLLYH